MARRGAALLRGVVLVIVVCIGVAVAVGVDRNRFRANDTLLGMPVPCSDAEKACFEYNRLLHPASGKCYRVGSPGPCRDSDFLLDRHAFETEGRLVGVCGDSSRCPDRRYRMAYDGQCYTGKEVFGTFCDLRQGTSAWPYFFGGYECVCDAESCPPARYVPQPQAPGQCYFPNFRKDFTRSFLPRLPKGELQCSPEQSRCFKNGEVSFGGQCYKLLKQGPCPEWQHLLLDKQEMTVQRKVATRCVPVDRCPTGTKFMTHHAMCVNVTQIENVMCPGLDTFTDVFGETVCRFKEEFFEVILKSSEERSCNIRYNVQPTGLTKQPKPKCTDPLECFPFEEIDPDMFGNYN